MDRWTRAMSGLIGLFAPVRAIQYAHNRQRLASYAGASPEGANKGWRPRNKTEDALLLRDRATLMARARDLERNSSHISGAIQKICNNVIYTGIFPQPSLKTSDGKLRKTENQRIKTAYQGWSKHPWVQFYAVQELVLRHLWIDGEVLVHRYWDDELRQQGLNPLVLDVLESDYLDSQLNTERNDNGHAIKQGVEYNTKGRPIAYHLFREHPGDIGAMGSRFTAERRRVPADEIKHIFFRKRGSQGRGASWLSSIIVEMRDFSEYQSSERIAARLASAFGAFIESPYPEHQYNHPLIQDTGEAAPTPSDIPKYFDPGRIDVLPPGMKINVAQYNRPGDSYEPFTKTSLKGASAGAGMSYENFSNDYEGSTYSSARQAMLEERRGYRKMQWFLVRQLLDWVWDTWVDYGRLSRVISGSIPASVPVQWQFPGWDWIDPQKDAKSAKIELDMKITNRRRIAARRGYDWDEEIEELADEEQILKDKNLSSEPEAEPGT